MSTSLLQHAEITKIEKEKQEGNQLFKEKKYKEALRIYKNIISYICYSTNENKNINGKDNVCPPRIKEAIQFFKSQEVPKKCSILKTKTEQGDGSMLLNGKRVENEKEENSIENIRSSFIKVCHNISLCYYFLEEFEKSIEFCFYIKEIDDSHFKCYNTLALCYEKLKNFQRSVDCFERCKVLLLKDSTITNKKGEINRINEKLKCILSAIDKDKSANIITFDHIKKVVQNKHSKEEEKLQLIHSLSNKKNYIIIKEKVLEFLYDVIISSARMGTSLSAHVSAAASASTFFSSSMSSATTATTTMTTNNSDNSNTNNSDGINCDESGDRIERACFLTIFKILSKVEYERAAIEKEKEEGYQYQKVCINKLEKNKFQFYYDVEYVKILTRCYDLFKENWIMNYAKHNLKKLENYQFSKNQGSCKNQYTCVVDILTYFINALKYIYTINNECMLKIINMYLNSGNGEIEECGLSTIIYLCKKKINITNISDKAKRKELLEKIEKAEMNIQDAAIDTHFSEMCKYPLCVNSEIKKIIENTIAIYDVFPIDAEYSLILLFTLLNDKNRSTEKDTDMNNLISEMIDLYFDRKEIQTEWFICVKCIFLVDKSIILNYLIGKQEYMYQLLNFINESIGRKPQNTISLYIEVLLLLLNIPELRVMLNECIHLYIQILKTLKYDVNLLKFIVGSFKLYMHSKEFKEKIKTEIDLYSYATELLKRFTHPFSILENKKNNTDVDINNVPIEKRVASEISIKEKKNAEIRTETENILKDLIEMFFYLSLHVEFKKKMLENSNKHMFYILIQIGDYINKQKLDNTYKYLYCNTINNLVMTRDDEKLRRRYINRNNLANFDNEQIEALEKFYENLPAAALNKNDPLFDYGDEHTSNQIITCLLYCEHYKNAIPVKTAGGVNSQEVEKKTKENDNYKNGYIINIIYNFIHSNFFTVNIAEAVCEIISKFVSDNKNVGLVLINGGLKLLLQASKHINNKRTCGKALSDIFIVTNPKLIQFHSAYDALPILIAQLNDDDELLILKALMAITNILVVDENIAVTAIQLHLWNKCYDILSSSNDYLRAASLECICNLCAQPYVHQFIFDKYKKWSEQNEKLTKKSVEINSEKREDDKSSLNTTETNGLGQQEQIDMVDLEILYAFTLEYDNYKAVFAATGALGMLSSDSRLSTYLVRTKKFEHVFTSFHKTNDGPILLRLLTLFSNIVFSENVPEGVKQKIKKNVQMKENLEADNKAIADLILQ